MKKRKKIGLVVGFLFGMICLGFLGIMICKKMEKTYPYSYYCVKTTYAEQNPRAILIESATELRKCFEDVFSDRFDLGYSEFEQMMGKYDMEYFQNRSLVLVLLGEMKDDIRPEVKKVYLNEDDKLEIQIDRVIPKEDFKEEYSEEWSYGWYLFVNMEKDISVTEDDIMVTLGEEFEENLVYTMHFPNGTPWPLEGNEAWDLINSMYLNRLEYQKAEECKCEPEYTIEIKSDVREERYEIHLEEGIVCSKKGQAYFEPDSLEYKAIEKGILNWRHMAARNGIRPDTSHLGFSVQYVYTGGNSNYIPKATCIRSVEELQQYFNENMVREDGEESYYAERFRNAIQKFDEEYFKKQVLVIVEKGDSIATVYYDVNKVSKNSNGELEIAIERLSPEAGDIIPSGWHFFIEIAEDMNVNGDEKIKLVLDDEVVEYPVATLKCSDGTTFVGDGMTALGIKNVISSYLFSGKENNCTCVPEYIVTIESDMRHEVYEINLSHGCIHYDGKSVSLEEDWIKRDFSYGIADWMHTMEVLEYPVATLKWVDGTTYFCEGTEVFELKMILFGILDFSKEDTSVWSPEYIVTIESDVRHEVYEIHLTEGCVRYDGKIAFLDEEQKRILADEMKSCMRYMQKK